jgi:hypothetical protein
MKHDVARGLFTADEVLFATYIGVLIGVALTVAAAFAWSFWL